MKAVYLFLAMTGSSSRSKSVDLKTHPIILGAEFFLSLISCREVFLCLDFFDVIQKTG